VPGTPMNKVKVLFLAANPSGTQPLKLDEEIRQITAKIRASDYRDALDLVSLWAVRSGDLLQGLLEHKPHIVHFSGHGSSTAEIILQDQDGRPNPVSKAALVALFRTLRDNVRVVLLNACSTRPQAEALGEIIDCVVGMNKPIGDAAAIAFAASFYRAIGFGRSVQEAFDLGKVALLLDGIAEDQTPELFVRKGVDAATLSLIVSPSKPGEDVVPRRGGGDSSTKPLPTMDRITFVNTLAGLDPADFELLVATIPDAARHVSRHGTIPEKVAELIRWAEGSTGPGIEAVQEAYRNFR
jgi:CHAT domain